MLARVARLTGRRDGPEDAALFLVDEMIGDKTEGRFRGVGERRVGPTRMRGREGPQDPRLQHRALLREGQRPAAAGRGPIEPAPLDIPQAEPERQDPLAQLDLGLAR